MKLHCGHEFTEVTCPGALRNELRLTVQFSRNALKCDEQAKSKLIRDDRCKDVDQKRQLANAVELPDGQILLVSLYLLTEVLEITFIELIFERWVNKLS